MSDEEEQAYYQEKERQNFIYDQGVYDPNKIDDSFKFKAKLLNISEEIKLFVKKEIIEANLSDKDKKRVTLNLILALDLAEFGLDPSPFVRDTTVIGAVTKGHKGFQQDKLNEVRDIKLAQFDNLKERKKRFWGRG